MKYRSALIPAVLVERCRARLAEQDLPQPFDVKTLCARVGERRQRPIILLGLKLPADAPHGLWIRSGERDYIIYERATSPLHQEHIILHELAHLLCGHVGSSLSNEHARRLFPTLDPALVERILARSAYSDMEEREAEVLAYVILREADRDRRPPQDSDPAAIETLRRLESNM